jgi:hypothetical protein
MNRANDELPTPKFRMYDPVILNGTRAEIATDSIYYARNDNGVMCYWYYVQMLIDDFISIQLVAETDLEKWSEHNE